MVTINSKVAVQNNFTTAKNKTKKNSYNQKYGRKTVYHYDKKVLSKLTHICIIKGRSYNDVMNSLVESFVRKNENLIYKK